ncbi:MAG TPA: flagellar basal-body rod protein FlgF [Burkholderiales bacterium]|jgi:flagellar basal-body rod protein FlgF|nr:flagellar basal-body rod protein FlgF [Burkholderiales bacterium]
MDRLIYVAMTGAKATLDQQASVAHNLANVSTTGFRAELSAFRAVPVQGEGGATRTFVVDATTGADFAPGAVQHTGRDLDIAVQGKGWIAVQAADGTEAYTRAGNLRLSPNNELVTASGNAVLGDGGPVAIPSDTRITIGGDGTVSTVPTDNRVSQNSTVGRIKLVNPPEGELERGGDGLFRLRGGGAAPVDDTVRLVSGAVESSNVNPVECMVSMITLSRQFDMQMKLLQNAESNSRQASQLLGINS